MEFNDAYIPGLGKSAAVRALVTEATERIAGDARADAPVDSGEYRDGIRTEYSETENRVVGHVVASAPHSMLVESRDGVLARALQQNAR